MPVTISPNSSAAGMKSAGETCPRTGWTHGVRTVAEGIETDDQLERITRLGFDRAQGFLLGRPMPQHAMDQLVAA